MVKEEATPVRELQTIIDSLSKGPQQMIIEKEIEQETHKQFRKKVLKTSKVKIEDCQCLTKARVIDTEEVLRLLEARDTADAMKATKAAGKQRRQKKSTTNGMERSTTPTKKKKVIIIEENGEFHCIGSSTKALGQEDGWYNEGEGDLEEDMRGFDGIVIKDEGREEVRRALRIAEMVANINRVFEEHGRSFRPRVAK
ncbi:hypothetical protein C7212DRAFT_362392 [Tuber magnatum]|uniref:Uncharacterized protein n=1 Tax=Tuber magnatum TaxID=42249 RepID=A0A317SVZ0_9PEZI|nr:hypothetical protein C7212DRAFT_362392 [Tuber magnatum]